MANPPITIGPFTNVPAPGSPIASPWAQQLTTFAVADDNIIRQAAVAISGSGSANIDATGGGTYATWLTVATVTPPAWAVSADVNIQVMGVDVITADSDYFLRPSMNVAGAEFLHSGLVGKRFHFPVRGTYPVTPSVVNSVIVAARRVGGTGFFRYAAGSVAVGTVTFRPS